MFADKVTLYCGWTLSIARRIAKLGRVKKRV